MNDDANLLHRYAHERSEAAFAELVRRHVDLVYSAALRRCNGDTHRAEDAVQQVFTALARNAEKLASHPALDAWLYAATRNAVINLALAEQRRAQREQEAVMSGMLSVEESGPDWSELRPVLDDVMDELSEPDRTAVLLRFFKKHSYMEIGSALDVSENTARMRTERALEKLRVLLGRRGVKSSAAALGLVLTRQAVVAAPASLAVAVTATILGIPASSVVAATGRGLAKTALTVGAWVLATALVTVGVFQARKIAAKTSQAGVTATSSTVVGKHEELAVAQSSLKALASQAPQPGKASVADRTEKAPSPPQAAVALTAADILKKMAAAYAALSSYQDSGEVVERGPNGEERSQTIFKIYFNRPRRYRFDYSWKAAKAAAYSWNETLWTDGEEAFSWDRKLNKTIKYPQLGILSLVKMGTSWGSSYHVPRFLFDTAERYFSLAALAEPALIGEQQVDEVLCYQIKGQRPNGNPYELWIGKEDFLIRKIKTLGRLSHTSAAVPVTGADSLLEEIHREIRINKAIPEAAFRVDAPK